MRAGPDYADGATHKKWNTKKKDVHAYAQSVGGLGLPT